MKRILFYWKMNGKLPLKQSPLPVPPQGERFATFKERFADMNKKWRFVIAIN